MQYISKFSNAGKPSDVTSTLTRNLSFFNPYEFSSHYPIKMSRVLRRLYSTSSQSAESVALQFLQKHQARPAHTHTQILDANQLQRLSATLNRPTFSIPANGEPVPPCYHLAYFTPDQPETELGEDGTDTR
jgi:hypothetical protein